VKVANKGNRKLGGSGDAVSRERVLTRVLKSQKGFKTLLISKQRKTPSTNDYLSCISSIIAFQSRLLYFDTGAPPSPKSTVAPYKYRCKVPLPLSSWIAIAFSSSFMRITLHQFQIGEYVKNLVK
jgi:hypothetical protein